MPALHQPIVWCQPGNNATLTWGASISASEFAGGLDLAT